MDRIDFPFKQKQQENMLKTGSVNYVMKTIKLNTKIKKTSK